MEQLGDLAQALSDNPAFESCDTPDTDCNLSSHKTRRRKSRKTDATIIRRRVTSDKSLSSGEDPARGNVRCRNKVMPRCLHSDSDESYTEHTMSRLSSRQHWLSRNVSTNQSENRMDGKFNYEHSIRRRRRQGRMSVDGCPPNSGSMKQSEFTGVCRAMSSSASPKRKRKRSATLFQSSESNHHNNYDEDEMEYSDPSSYLSSDENHGFVTNDEGREGDDEQSDFFHEPGSAPSVGIVTLLDSDSLRSTNYDSDFEDGKNPQLCRLLNDCFVSMSQRSRENYPARLARVFKHKGREFRQGCRRIKNQSRDPMDDSSPLHQHHGVGSIAADVTTNGYSDTGGEKKRRKDPDQYFSHTPRR